MDPVLGLPGGVVVGVLAGVLVDGDVAGLLVFSAMYSKRSFGSWWMLFSLSPEPAVQMYLP